MHLFRLNQRWGCLEAQLKVKVTQSCPILWDSIDCSPPGSSVRGILQARVLEWVSISFSRGSSWPRDWTRSPALQVDSLSSEPLEKTSYLPYYPSLWQLWDPSKILLFHRTQFADPKDPQISKKRQIFFYKCSHNSLSCYWGHTCRNP